MVNIIKYIYYALLSEKTKQNAERFTIYLAVASFLGHLLLILLVHFGLISVGNTSYLLGDPIAAIYTPFSFILLYEVYLLVYYLPKSITIYVGKQYEIITLIVIRRIFKDLSNLKLTSDWFKVQDDLQFTFDILATLVLFLLISWFYQLNRQRIQKKKQVIDNQKALKHYIQIKKGIGTLLVPVFLVLAIYSFGGWLQEGFTTKHVLELSDINKIFFDEFFTVLILTDVLLLLFSLLYANKFSVVMRNSGFIISTILIRLSFTTTGIINIILITVAVLFGVLILVVHNRYLTLEDHVES